MTDSTRDAFEAWYSDNGANPRLVERNKETYQLVPTAICWWAWQAATLAEQERCADKANQLGYDRFAEDIRSGK